MFAEIQNLKSDTRSPYANKVSMISNELKDAYDNQMATDRKKSHMDSMKQDLDIGNTNQDFTSSKMSKYERFAKNLKRPMQLGSGGTDFQKETGKFSVGRSIQNPFA